MEFLIKETFTGQFFYHIIDANSCCFRKNLEFDDFYRVFSLIVSNPSGFGTRSVYFVATSSEMFQFMVKAKSNEERCFREVVQAHDFTKLYLELDFISKSEKRPNPVICETVALLNRIFSETLNKTIEFANFLILDASSDEKAQFQLLLNNGIVFQSHCCVKSIVRRLNNIVMCEDLELLKLDNNRMIVNENVYNNVQEIRMPFTVEICQQKSLEQSSLCRFYHHVPKKQTVFEDGLIVVNESDAKVKQIIKCICDKINQQNLPTHSSQQTTKPYYANSVSPVFPNQSSKFATKRNVPPKSQQLMSPLVEQQNGPSKSQKFVSFSQKHYNLAHVQSDSEISSDEFIGSDNDSEKNGYFPLSIAKNKNYKYGNHGNFDDTLEQLELMNLDDKVIRQNSFQIFIYTGNSLLTTIDCKSTDLVSNVKTKIWNKRDIPEENQTLYFCGKLIRDDLTLAYYQIEKDSNLQLVTNHGLLGGKSYNENEIRDLASRLNKEIIEQLSNNDFLKVVAIRLNERQNVMSPNLNQLIISRLQSIVQIQPVHSVRTEAKNEELRIQSKKLLEQMGTANNVSSNNVPTPRDLSTLSSKKSNAPAKSKAKRPAFSSTEDLHEDTSRLSHKKLHKDESDSDDGNSDYSGDDDYPELTNTTRRLPLPDPEIVKAQEISYTTDLQLSQKLIDFKDYLIIACLFNAGVKSNFHAKDSLLNECILLLTELFKNCTFNGLNCDPTLFKESLESNRVDKSIWTEFVSDFVAFRRNDNQADYKLYIEKITKSFGIELFAEDLAAIAGKSFVNTNAPNATAPAFCIKAIRKIFNASNVAPPVELNKNLNECVTNVQFTNLQQRMLSSFGGASRRLIEWAFYLANVAGIHPIGNERGEIEGGTGLNYIFPNTFSHLLEENRHGAFNGFVDGSAIDSYALKFNNIKDVTIIKTLSIDVLKQEIERIQPDGLVIFPVNLEMHYYVISVDFRVDPVKVCDYDSLPGWHDASRNYGGQSKAKNCLDTFVDMLKKKFPKKKFESMVVENCQMQNDGTKCGIYASAFVQQIATGRNFNIDADVMRCQLAIRLLEMLAEKLGQNVNNGFGENVGSSGKAPGIFKALPVFPRFNTTNFKTLSTKPINNAEPEIVMDELSDLADKDWAFVKQHLHVKSAVTFSRKDNIIDMAMVRGFNDQEMLIDTIRVVDGSPTYQYIDAAELIRLNPWIGKEREHPQTEDYIVKLNGTIQRYIERKNKVLLHQQTNNNAK